MCLKNRRNVQKGETVIVKEGVKMKKASRLTRLISTFLCAVMLFTLLPISNAMATTNGNLQIEDVYTDKAAYAPGGEAIITVQLSNPTSTNATELLRSRRIISKIASRQIPFLFQ